MSLALAGGSTQYLKNASNTAGVVGYPVNVGMWIWLNAVGTVTRNLWSVSDTGTTNNYLRLDMNSSEQIAIGARGGGTENIAAVGTAITAGAWHYVLGRFISATNRQARVLFPNGAIDSASTATSRTPGGIDALLVGALETSGGVVDPWDGLIAEYFCATGDLLDGAPIAEEHVRCLAYGGPFQFPLLVQHMFEYHSFRKFPDHTGYEVGESYFNGKDLPPLTGVNGPTISHHPPLPYWFERPGQRRRPLVI